MKAIAWELSSSAYLVANALLVTMPQALPTINSPATLCLFRKISFPGAWFYEVIPQRPLNTEAVLTRLDEQFYIHWNRLVLRGLTDPTSVHGYYESVFDYADYQRLLEANDSQDLVIGDWVEVTHS